MWCCERETINQNKPEATARSSPAHRVCVKSAISTLQSAMALVGHVRHHPGRQVGRRTVEIAVRDRPLHGRVDEHRRELDALAAAAVAVAAGVDLVAVVLVVGYPVDMIQRPVIMLEGVVVIVPEALQ